MSAPTIALVVPAYNASRFLPELFTTVREQTEPFDEVIVVDDASSDDTLGIAESLGATVVRHERNAGCSAAKNTGLAAVRSDWVHFHDSDDLLHGEFAARARRRVGSGTFDALLFEWEHRDGATGALIATSRLDRARVVVDPVAYMLENTVNNIGAYRVASVRSVGGFSGEPDVLFNEDRAFHLALACSGAKFEVESYVGSTTRQWSNSMSQGAAVKCLLANAAITERYLDANPGKHDLACARQLWHVASGLASWLQWPDAHRLVSRASALGLSTDPGARSWFGRLSALSPHLALRLREYSIRLVRPHLRRR